jgi:hypothetical protein
MNVKGIGDWGLGIGEKTQKGNTEESSFQFPIP